VILVGCFAAIAYHSHEAICSVKINLDDLWIPAMTALRRGYVFAGFGVNASDHPDIQDFHLPLLFKRSPVPFSVSAEVLAQYKQDFRAWILGNAFREIVIGLEVSLNRAFQVCCLARQKTQQRIASRKEAREFNYAGVDRKLEILERDFSVAIPERPFIASLNKARNCLSHRSGFVSPPDCTESEHVPEKLVLLFTRFEIVVTSDGSRESIVPHDAIAPVQLEPGGTLQLRHVEVRKEFNLGTVINLDPADIRDIVHTVELTIAELRKKIIGYFTRQGIVVKEPPPLPERQGARSGGPFGAD